MKIIKNRKKFGKKLFILGIVACAGVCLLFIISIKKHYEDLDKIHTAPTFFLVILEPVLLFFVPIGCIAIGTILIGQWSYKKEYPFIDKALGKKPVNTDAGFEKDSQQKEPKEIVSEEVM